MIDVGTNLADKTFRDDLAQVVERASEVGVGQMITIGTTMVDSRRSLEIARAHPGVVFATAGIHPHYAKDVVDDDLAELETLAREPEIVAVGECGLDFFRDLSPRDVQERRLVEQLDLAARLGMPAYLHERDAGTRMVEILAEHRDRLQKVLVHCFTGEGAVLERYLDMDCHVGITGWICDERRGVHLRELVRRIPANRLVIETDAPYLLPRTIRPRPKSRRNEPAFLIWVRDMVGESVGKTSEQIAEETTATARSLFGIGDE